MARWFYVFNGQESGPISSVELKRLADAGHITPDTRVRREGVTKWYVAKQIRGLVVNETEDAISQSANGMISSPLMANETMVPNPPTQLTSQIPEAAAAPSVESQPTTNLARSRWAKCLNYVRTYAESSKLARPVGLIAAAFLALMILLLLIAHRKSATLAPPSNDATTTGTGAPFGDSTPSQIEPSRTPKYWLGITIGSIAPDSPLRDVANLPADQGLLVKGVTAKSPAEKAGLKLHDILLRVNGIGLRNASDLSSKCETKKQLTLELIRGGTSKTILLMPEERPPQAPRSWDLILTESEIKGRIDKQTSQDDDMTSDDSINLRRTFGLNSDGDSQSGHRFQNVLGLGLDCNIDLTVLLSEDDSIARAKHERQTYFNEYEMVQVDGQPRNLRKYADDQSPTKPHFEKRKNDFYSSEFKIPMIGDESFCHEWAGKFVVCVRFGRVFFEVRCKDLDPAIAVARAQLAKLQGKPATLALDGTALGRVPAKSSSPSDFRPASDSRYDRLNRHIEETVGKSSSEAEIRIQIRTLNELGSSAEISEEDLIQEYDQALRDTKERGLSPAFALQVTIEGAAYSKAYKEMRSDSKSTPRTDTE